MRKNLFLAGSLIMFATFYLHAQQTQGGDVNVFLKKKNAGLAYNKGIDNIKAGKYQEAATNFTEAINLNPSFDLAYLQ